MTIERKFIENSIIKRNISKYLEKELIKAGFAKVDVQHTPILTRITIYVLNPGRAIGRSGSTINTLTETIHKLYKVENPQINIIQVENRMLEPLIVARDIAEKLERGLNARKILQSTLRYIMENGALGADIVVTGKLAAKGAKAKQIKKGVGYIPKAGNVVELVNEAHTTAYPKYGAIGIKVRIVPPGTVFPDREIKTIEIPKAILNA
ncbi:MAG: 30S ribosomal protein S3 [Candidatus Marsarchaeota archaeon]|jgi:small subunit ribosomal protein S3|nr:30S ribosomal protein S3 [Candidatus Marsarchaeota archaeon]